MKNQQRREAQSLYLNTGLTKSQIADQLSISRRTVYQWSLEGDWDKLRKSAQHMPAILAEKCYYLIGHFADYLLSAESQDMPITKRDVDMLHKLTLTLHKLKQGSTVSEAMQTFTILLGRIQCHDPALAEMVAPHIQAFVQARRKFSEASFLLEGFNQEGYLDPKEEDPTEHELDRQDLTSLLQEMKAANTNTAQQPGSQIPSQQPQPNPAQSQLTPKPTTTASTSSSTPKPPTPQSKQSFRDRNKSLYSRSHVTTNAPAIPKAA